MAKRMFFILQGKVTLSVTLQKTHSKFLSKKKVIRLQSIQNIHHLDINYSTARNVFKENNQSEKELLQRLQTGMVLTELFQFILIKSKK